MFNKIREKTEKEIDKLHEERIARCVPVARKILGILLADIETLPIGENTSEDDDKKNKEIALKVLNLLLAENVRVVDREFIMQLVLQPGSILQKTVADSLNHSWDVAQTGLWGKTYSDLTFADLDTALSKGDMIEEKKEI